MFCKDTGMHIVSSTRIGATMGKLSKKAQRRVDANKRQALDQRIKQDRDEFRTGYSERSLQRAALNGAPVFRGGTSKQITKRHTQQWPSRWGDGDTEHGHRKVSGRTDKSQGTFLNPNESKSAIVDDLPYQRAMNYITGTGNTVSAFRNKV